MSFGARPKDQQPTHNGERTSANCQARVRTRGLSVLIGPTPVTYTSKEKESVRMYVCMYVCLSVCLHDSTTTASGGLIDATDLTSNIVSGACTYLVNTRVLLRMLFK